LQKSDIELFGWQHVSSAGFPTSTSLASAARIFQSLDFNPILNPNPNDQGCGQDEEEFP
jgi:hypothetical protein